ncbi:MmgE/PrpD family protein [Amorphus sp. 3PC139-8]|uniref:MmgE/PrpD family protein n=1 Tax=Amorphus sp. 3PC139-8 TaxID=2735676 RepID=UPI00345DE507
MSEPLLGPLAQWCAAFDARACDAEDRARLFAIALDYASALLSGTGHVLAPPYRAALAGPQAGEGPCGVAGSSRPAPVSAAAQANAATAHFWEVDDAHRTSTSHPGVTVLPVVMALAEADPSIPLDRLQGAVVVGYEAMLRVGSWLGPAHYAVCHTTATAGCFAAAAAAAHALGLDTDRTLAAFGHAGTQAAGLWQFLDDDVSAAKAFHCATPVRNGLAAAFLAQAGIPGAPHVLEGRRGMARAWGLDGGPADMLRPEGRAMMHDVTVKGWPTCGQMHSALDCATDVAAQIDAKAGEIASVLVEVPQSCLDVAFRTAPRDVAAAKFATAFCIGAVLAGRPPTFTGLNEDLLADPAVRALEAMTEVRAEPAFTARFPKERPARVSVTMADGRQLSAERSHRRGDPEEPWSEAEMIRRASDILTLACVPVDVDRLVGWCRGFASADANGRWRAADLVGFSLAETMA